MVFTKNKQSRTNRNKSKSSRKKSRSSTQKAKGRSSGGKKSIAGCGSRPSMPTRWRQRGGATQCQPYLISADLGNPDSRLADGIRAPCAMGLAESILPDRGRLRFLGVGCWGTYCYDPDVRSNQHLYVFESNKRLTPQEEGEAASILAKERTAIGPAQAARLFSLCFISADPVPYRQALTVKMMNQYYERYNAPDFVLLAGDNIYNQPLDQEGWHALLPLYWNSLPEEVRTAIVTGLKSGTERAIIGEKVKDLVKPVLSALLHGGYNLGDPYRAQYDIGFLRCFRLFRNVPFYVAPGNHDIKSCSLINHQVDRDSQRPQSVGRRWSWLGQSSRDTPRWQFPALFYTLLAGRDELPLVLRGLQAAPLLSTIVIDTNLYEEDYCFDLARAGDPQPSTRNICIDLVRDLELLSQKARLALPTGEPAHWLQMKMEERNRARIEEYRRIFETLNPIYEICLKNRRVDLSDVQTGTIREAKENYSRLKAEQNMDYQTLWIWRMLTHNRYIPWKIIMGHVPVYTCPHKEKKVGKKGSIGSVNMQTFLVPLMEEFGVQFYFCADEHNFQWLRRGKVNYFICGTGGADPDKDIFFDDRLPAKKVEILVPSVGPAVKNGDRISSSGNQIGFMEWDITQQNCRVNVFMKDPSDPTPNLERFKTELLRLRLGQSATQPEVPGLSAVSPRKPAHDMSWEPSGAGKDASGGYEMVPVQ